MFLKKKSIDRLYDRTEEERPPLVRDRRSLVISIILLLVVILLSIVIREPGALTLVEWLFQWVGLPIHSGENGRGFHFPNLFLLMLLVAVFFVLDRALNRGIFIAFIVIMMLVSNAPGWITTSYQRLFASGVYAVEVNLKGVNCNYVREAREFTGTCQIPQRIIVEISLK